MRHQSRGPQGLYGVGDIASKNSSSVYHYFDQQYTQLIIIIRAQKLVKIP